MKFVLMHLPGKVTYKEIEEMIETVDRNGDGKISFSEILDYQKCGGFIRYTPSTK